MNIPCLKYYFQHKPSVQTRVTQQSKATARTADKNMQEKHNMKSDINGEYCYVKIKS